MELERNISHHFQVSHNAAELTAAFWMSVIEDETAKSWQQDFPFSMLCFSKMVHGLHLYSTLLASSQLSTIALIKGLSFSHSHTHSHTNGPSVNNCNENVFHFFHCN